jgi:hypothetical protein
MGRAKQYPSIVVAKRMGFAKGSTHPTRCWQVTASGCHTTGARRSRKPPGLRD